MFALLREKSENFGFFQETSPELGWIPFTSLVSLILLEAFNETPNTTSINAQTDVIQQNCLKKK